MPKFTLLLLLRLITQPTEAPALLAWVLLAVLQAWPTLNDRTLLAFGPMVVTTILNLDGLAVGMASPVVRTVVPPVPWLSAAMTPRLFLPSSPL